MALRRPDSSRPGRDATPGQAARVKRFHSKSRRGCLTCRQRRVKCDERREPTCLRCEKGGYVCEWQDTPQTRSTTSASSDRASSQSRRSPSRNVSRSGDESGLPSHKFFRDGVVVGIVSLFTEMIQSFTLDQDAASQNAVQISEFYYKFVHPASQTSSIIRKTLTALCGLFHRVTATTSSPPRDPTFIQYYSDTVTDLRQTTSQLPPDIVLIACVLFANCEYLMGYLCSALQHLRAGANILAEHKGIDDGRLSPELVDNLEHIFGAFNHEAVVFSALSQEEDYFDAMSSVKFANLAEANSALRQIYFHVFALLELGKSQPVHSRTAVRDFQRWSKSWQNRCENIDQSAQHDERPWLHLLYSHQQALNIIIDKCGSPGQIHDDDDNYETSAFDEVVLRIASFFENCPDYGLELSAGDKPFPSHAGLIAPLFHVTMECPDLTICRTALELLKRLKTTEGQWNSCIAYKIAESIVTSRSNFELSNFTQNVVASANDTKLPVAEVKGIQHTPNREHFELELGIFDADDTNPFGSVQKTLFDRSCACVIDDDAEALHALAAAKGYQGYITPRQLSGCTCHDQMPTI